MRGSHTASLGLAITPNSDLPAPFSAGAFGGQHGFWSRRPPGGYRVLVIRFAEGNPDGEPVDVLPRFLDADGQARGRQSRKGFPRSLPTFSKSLF
jgi:glucose/arabinose dehydrogenase